MICTIKTWNVDCMPSCSISWHWRSLGLVEYMAGHLRPWEYTLYSISHEDYPSLRQDSRQLLLVDFNRAAALKPIASQLGRLSMYPQNEYVHSVTSIWLT